MKIDITKVVVTFIFIFMVVLKTCSKGHNFYRFSGCENISKGYNFCWLVHKEEDRKICCDYRQNTEEPFILL